MWMYSVQLPVVHVMINLQNTNYWLSLARNAMQDTVDDRFQWSPYMKCVEGECSVGKHIMHVCLLPVYNP